MCLSSGPVPLRSLPTRNMINNTACTEAKTCDDIMIYVGKGINTQHAGSGRNSPTTPDSATATDSVVGTRNTEGARGRAQARPAPG